MRCHLKERQLFLTVYRPCYKLTNGNASSSDTLSDTPLRGEAQSDKRKAGNIQEASTNTNANSLCEEDLVILPRQTQHKETKHD